MVGHFVNIFNKAYFFFLKGDCDKSYGSEFVFSDHAKELIVGEIFVRVYNEVPTFQLEVRLLILLFVKKPQAGLSNGTYFVNLNQTAISNSILKGIKS